MALRFQPTLLPAGFEPAALNDAGLVVGTRDEKRAVVLRRGRLSVLPGKSLGNVGRSRDSALGVSSDGTVAGGSFWLFGEPFQQPGIATLWRNGRRIDAPKVEGFSHGSFSGVNARGEAVGFAGTATMWEDRDASGEAEQTGVMTQHSKAIYFDGKTVHVEGWGGLSAINDAGATVGSLDGQAVFRTSAKAAWTKICRGEAVGVSPRGLVCGNQIAGDSKRIQSQVTIGGKTDTTYFPLWRGFLWQKGKLVELPALPGFDESRALGVRDDGWVVGVSGSEKKSATLWQDGKPVALDTLVSLRGWKLTEAFAVTPHGRILCAAEDAKGHRRHVLLTRTDKQQP